MCAGLTFTNRIPAFSALCIIRYMSSEGRIEELFDSGILNANAFGTATLVGGRNGAGKVELLCYLNNLAVDRE